MDTLFPFAADPLTKWSYLMETLLACVYNAILLAIYTAVVTIVVTALI